MESITIVFGKRIKNLRLGKKLSQEKLAELCGLHATYIGQIERGEKSPTIETVQKISFGLEVPVAQLFGKSGEVCDDIFAQQIYNEVLSLSHEKQEKIYRIIKEICLF